MTMADFATDGLSQVDALGRTGFARSMLGIVRNVDASEGAVVGLAGAWGSGKSWLLRQLKSLYDQDASNDDVAPADRLHWVTFSPWALSGSETLVEAMLVEIATQVDFDVTLASQVEAGKAVTKSVLEYAATLAQARHLLSAASGFLMGSYPEIGIILGGAAFAGKAVGEVADKGLKSLKASSNKQNEKTKDKEANRLQGTTIKTEGALRGSSLAEGREKVRAALENLGGKVVVVIDDLDRMAPREMAEILQTVKAVANFPNVVYILSYDARVAAHGLEKSLQVQDGLAYLDKIIQVPLDVPDPSPVKLMQCGMKMVGDVARICKTDPVPSEGERIELASALMQRPRDIVRWRTRLLFSLPHIQGAIDIEDVVLLLALQVKAPKVIEYLNQNRAFFFEAEHLRHNEALRRLGQVREGKWGDKDFDSVQTEREDQLKELFGELGSLSIIAERSLQALDIGPGTDFGSLPDAQFRVRNLANWMRLRGMSRESVTTDSDDLVAMLERPSLIKNSIYMNSAQSAYELFELFEPYLKLQERGFHPGVTIDVPGLATVLNEVVARYGEDTRLPDGSLWPLNKLAALFGKISNDDMLRIVRSSLEGKTVAETGNLLRRARSQFERDARYEDDQSIEQLKPLIEVWKSRAYAFIDNTGTFPLSERRPGDIIKLLIELGESPPDVAARVTASMRKGPEGGVMRWLGPQPIGDMEVAEWAGRYPGWPTAEFLAELIEESPDFQQAKPVLSHAFLSLRPKK